MTKPNGNQFIPLPFLLFASGKLRTANAGARVLLGLADHSLEVYTYDDIFPSTHTNADNDTTVSTEDPALTSKVSPYLNSDGKSTSSVKTEGHLQSLTARVQSSQEALALKAAVYTNQSDGAMRSVLIVDISPSLADIPATSPKSSNNRRSSFSSSGEAAIPPSSSSSIPSIIKRHSGDIRRYFSQSSNNGSANGSTGSIVPATAASQPGTSMSIDEEDENDSSNSNNHPPHLGRRTTVMASRVGRDTPTPRSGPTQQDPTLSSDASHGASATSPAFVRTRSGTAHKQKSNMSLKTHPSKDPSLRTGLTPPGSPVIPLKPHLPSIGTNSSDQSSGTTSGSGLSGRSSRKRPNTLHLPLDGIDYSLAHAALAAHPRTGVIISRNDLSSGFINSRTRELLMGLKSPDNESSDPFDDMWFAPHAGKEKTVLEEEGIGQPSGSPLWEDDIIFEDGKVRIDLPEKGFNMQTSVSDILRWSLKRRKLRQHHRVVRDDMSVSSGVSASPPPSVSGAAPSSTSASLYNYRGGMTAGEAKAFMESWQSERPWLAHKPYKVYDAAFTQRTEDPFEALFDQCIRKDETPPTGSESITVGIETEVGPADRCSFPEHECFTYMTENSDPNKPEGLVPIRVRRRIIQARAAPLKDSTGDHVGGVVWLRDITGEMGTVPTTPHAGTTTASNPLTSVPSAAAQTSAFLGMPMGDANAGSDPFWQQIINSMPQMVWVTKPDGSHIYFNNKWYSFTGLQPEQSLGVNWQNPFHPDDMPAVRRNWGRSLATGEPYSVEYRCRRHDGVWRWQLGRAQALLDANGKIIAWFGTCTDVEEFVQIRTQLAETSENLRRVIDLASITLCCVDKDLKVQFLEGSGALKHYGYQDYKSRPALLRQR